MSTELNTSQLDLDGYFKEPQSFHIRKPFHAYDTALQCIELLLSLNGELDSAYLADMLEGLKEQLDKALEIES